MHELVENIVAQMNERQHKVERESLTCCACELVVANRSLVGNNKRSYSLHATTERARAHLEPTMSDATGAKLVRSERLKLALAADTSRNRSRKVSYESLAAAIQANANGQRQRCGRKRKRKRRHRRKHR